MWLDDPSNAKELLPGEITLVRGGSPHFIASESGADCLEPDDFRAKYALGAPPADQSATVFLCGAYQFSGDVGNGLLEALPQSTTISYVIGEPLYDVISLISRELLNSEPGQQTVLERLLDVLLVLVLRSDFEHNEKAPGWYTALANPRLRAALQAMHDDPSHSWTVPELAEVSGMSRAAFAQSFRETIGQAPLQYLTEWRMTLARDHLREGVQSLAKIATEVGYASPYAFATAFRRHHGVPPGAWRQQQPLELLTINGLTNSSG
jgi:AraC-like DNA-binding protein